MLISFSWRENRSASLVAHYNSHGYPNISYRDRIRIILAASIWTTFVASESCATSSLPSALS